MFTTVAFFLSTELLKCMYIQLPTCSWTSAQQGKQACTNCFNRAENLRNIHRDQIKTSYEALIRLDSFSKEFLLLLLVLSISWGFVKEQPPPTPCSLYAYCGGWKSVHLLLFSLLHCRVAYLSIQIHPKVCHFRALLWSHKVACSIVKSVSCYSTL